MAGCQHGNPDIKEEYSPNAPFKGLSKLSRLASRLFFARSGAALGKAPKKLHPIFFKGHSMRQIKALILFCVCLAVFLTIGPSAAHADKASAAIDAPQSALIGSSITIKITITHNANNFIHYTKWAHVLINGTSVARWDFSSFNRPESSVFTREIQYTVTGPLGIEAEAHCNIHGSQGPATAAVSTMEQGRGE
jgi:desulfoferrodoxin (superoxide reductase-like protein)